jgi:hypothetical protein
VAVTSVEVVETVEVQLVAVDQQDELGVHLLITATSFATTSTTCTRL